MLAHSYGSPIFNCSSYTVPKVFKMLVRIFTLILADRLRDVTVAVGETFSATAGVIDKSAFVECGTYPGAVPAGASITIHCNRTAIGTFVAVWMKEERSILCLCEVEVYAS